MSKSSVKKVIAILLICIFFMSEVSFAVEMSKNDNEDLSNEETIEETVSKEKNEDVEEENAVLENNEKQNDVDTSESEKNEIEDEKESTEKENEKEEAKKEDSAEYGNKDDKDNKEERINNDLKKDVKSEEKTVEPKRSVTKSVEEENVTETQTRAVQTQQASTNILEDGLYEIEVGVNSSCVVDVVDSSKVAGANVQTSKRNNARSQKVELKHVGDGYYTIQFKHSNMFLDVYYAKTADGTNVWQCGGNGADAQKWLIKDAGNGYYNIISKCGGKYLTVHNGTTSSGTNIEIYSKKSTSDKSQMFKIKKVETIVGTKTIEDGMYEIEIAGDSGKAIDVKGYSYASGANVQIFARNGADCQRAKVKYVGDGYYTFEFVHSGKFLDVANAGVVDGTNVWQCWKNGSDAQKWIIKDAGDGYYNIISKCSGTYLTVYGGATANSTNVEINSKKNNASQKFKFNKIEPIVGTQTIADGEYEIETKVNSNKVLEVYGAEKRAGANVQINERNNSKNQRVNVKYLGDGYYTIHFKHSGMFLDVYYAKTANGTNVWQCWENGSDAQKWIIKDAGNGYYNIISKCAQKYLTVYNGSTSNGTNIEIYAANSSNSQKFKFNKIETPVGTKTIEDGIYEIEIAGDSSKALDVKGYSYASGANVQIFTKNGAECQRVRAKYVGDGYYTFEFVHSGKFLDVANAETVNGTNVWQCWKNGSDAQKWIVKDAGNGYYNIISKCSGTYLTVCGGATANSTNIEINSKKNNASQKFKFNKIEAIVGTKTIESGTYTIESALNSNKVLDVAGAGTNSGANVQLYDKNKSLCQKVVVEYLGDGYYTLMFKHSGKFLDVANAKTANGTNVWQCWENGADAQKWIIKDAGNGYYNIISKCSNTYLTVENGKTANGTNIQIYSNKNDNSQKYRFKTPESPTGKQTIADGTYEIETAVDSNKAVEVADGSQNGGANVQIYTKNMAKCQKVEVKYVGNGYYTMKFAHSGKFLDVANAGKADKTNVWQGWENGSDAQKWIIKDAGNGYYNIISKCTETYLTVAGGNSAEKTNIEVNRYANNNSQKFRFNVGKNVIGIDVSSHQGTIDWNQVKNSNVDFAIIRCGYGQNQTDQDDAMFQRNISECERLKIPYGVYIYSYALDEAAAASEAEHVIRLIKGHNPTMGIWFDMEDADGYKSRHGMPSNEMLVKICLKFFQTMKARGYNNVGLYASLSWLNNQLNDSRLDQYDKWVAQWNTTCTYKKKYVMWQYTDKGTVTGINGYVDMNKYYY